MGVAAGAKALLLNALPCEGFSSGHAVPDDASGQRVLAATGAGIVLQGIGRRTAEGATGTNQFDIGHGMKPFCNPSEALMRCHAGMLHRGEPTARNLKQK